jgi:hypothetical protein
MKPEYVVITFNYDATLERVLLELVSKTFPGNKACSLRG